LENLAAKNLAEIQAVTENLEKRVQERTSELANINAMLMAEIAERRRVEAARRESEQRYKQLLDSVTDYIYTVKLENGLPVTTVHGPNCEAVTGYSPQEYVQDPDLWRRMIYEQDQPMVLEQVNRLLAGKPAPPFEHRLVHKDGSIRWVRNATVLRQDEQGRFIAYDGLITDITTRKQLEEHLTAIHTLGQELTLLRDETAIINRALGTAANVLQITRASCGLVSDTTGELIYHHYLAASAVEPLKPPALSRDDFEAIAYAYGLIEDLTANVNFDKPHNPDLTVMRTGQPLTLANSTQQIPYEFDHPEWPTSSILVVPMRIGERVIGVLHAASQEPDYFDSNDQQLLQTLADQTAVALEIARLFKAEQATREQAQILRQATAALTSTLELNQVLDSILLSLEQLVPYYSACVFLWDGEVLQVVAGRGGAVQEQVVGRSYPLEGSPDQAEVDWPEHVLRLINAIQGFNFSDNPVGWMGLPLIARERVIGYLTLDSFGAAPFGQAQAALAQAFANQAAVAIQNARLFAQVRAGREQLQLLSRRLVEVQETERRHIARELHDEAGQTLTSLIVGLRLLEREMAQPEVAAARLTELKRITDNILENLHRLAMDLRPASLDHLGLVAALGQYIETFNRQHFPPLMAQFAAMGLKDVRLSAVVETTLYRIVQEALTNVARHAQATRVDVLLKRRGNQVVIIIEDNGVGFNFETAIQSRRLGLLGMRERAEMLNGRLTVESSPGQGTTIQVEVLCAD
jgi:PAS domain S-box-containing protein